MGTSRLTYALALLALVACGGGGDTGPPDHADVVVCFDDVAPGRSGECDWNGDVVHVRIDPFYSSEFYGSYRDAILRHELWHALTRIEEHSADEHCISFSPAPDALWVPCQAERVQVIESAFTPLRVSFPEDPACLQRVADWWNANCGPVIEVVP